LAAVAEQGVEGGGAVTCFGVADEQPVLFADGAYPSNVAPLEGWCAA
jgi:hypothetical protein